MDVPAGVREGAGRPPLAPCRRAVVSTAPPPCAAARGPAPRPRGHKPSAATFSPIFVPLGRWPPDKWPRAVICAAGLTPATEERAGQPACAKSPGPVRRSSRQLHAFFLPIPACRGGTRLGRVSACLCTVCPHAATSRNGGKTAAKTPYCMYVLLCTLSGNAPGSVAISLRKSPKVVRTRPCCAQGALPIVSVRAYGGEGASRPDRNCPGTLQVVCTTRIANCAFSRARARKCSQ